MGWGRHAIVCTVVAIAIAGCGTILDVSTPDGLPVIGGADGAANDGEAGSSSVVGSGFGEASTPELADAAPDSNVSLPVPMIDASDGIDAGPQTSCSDLCVGKCGSTNGCNCMSCATGMTCTSNVCVADPTPPACVPACPTGQTCDNGTCKCVEQPDATTCATASCGTKLNNCGRVVTCANKCSDIALCGAGIGTGPNECCAPLPFTCPMSSCAGTFMDSCNRPVNCTPDCSACCPGGTCSVSRECDCQGNVNSCPVQ